MKLSLKYAFAAIILFLSLGAPMSASPLEDAATAYLRQDYANALRLIRPLADQGVPDAEYNLGLMHAIGQGVPQNYLEALKWFRLAADHGNDRAQSSLGVIYQYGRGVPQNYAEALKWNRLAADQGNARARTNLGVLYHYGQGAPQNEAEAVKLYRLAADQGSTEAQTNLAIMYEQGQGVTKDSAEAMRLYRLAADQGYAPAQSGLGAMYADAQGDNVSAYMWFSLSAAQGYQNGARNLEAIARRMSASQIAEAQKRASVSDLAVILVSEYEAWFQSLASKGVLPRAFTGVTKNGNQVVVVLTGLPLDHVQRRDFLIWLCQTEQFVAYAYATRVGVAADSDSAITDSLDIYASSDRYDASKTLGIDKLTDGTHKFIDQHQVVLPANPENGLFFGLQHSTHNISGDDQELFRKLWSDLKPKSMWQQR